MTTAKLQQVKPRELRVRDDLDSLVRGDVVKMVDKSHMVYHSRHMKDVLFFAGRSNDERSINYVAVFKEDITIINGDLEFKYAESTRTAPLLGDKPHLYTMLYNEADKILNEAGL